MVPCPRCAFGNAGTDAFCVSCGEFLEWNGRVGAAAAPTLRAAGRAGQVTETRIPAGRRAEEADGLGRSDPSRADQVRCSSCGSGNLPTHRFCHRCGERLVRRALRDEEPVAANTVKLPWWRRFVFWFFWRHRGGARIFDAGTRPGRRPVRRVGLEPVPRRSGRLSWLRATWKRIWPDVLLALMIALLVALLTPGVRGNVVDWVEHRLGKPVPVAQAQMAVVSRPGCAVPACTGHPAALVVDEFTTTYWVGPWNAKANPSLTVRFARPVDLTSVIVHLVDEKHETDRYRLPMQLEFVYDNGKRDVVTTKDVDDLAKGQKGNLREAKRVSRATIYVRAVHPSLHKSPYVALTNLEFFEHPS